VWELQGYALRGVAEPAIETAMVPTDGASTAVPAVSAAALRRLWDQGRRAQTVRAVVASWPRVLAERADLRWLEGLLRQAGLPAEATAVQAEMAGRSASDARAREALVRSVLDGGDPRWARELLDASGPSSRALQALRIEAELAISWNASPLRDRDTERQEGQSVRAKDTRARMRSQLSSVRLRASLPRFNDADDNTRGRHDKRLPAPTGYGDGDAAHVRDSC
jgi:hypothetical protein